jgi:hemin uptake protein HemP
VIDSAQWFAERKEIQIRHAGQLYRLRVTKNGKLILNK